MTLSIKGGGGIINEVPNVFDLKVTSVDRTSIEIKYKIEDVELTICRHYLLLNGVKIEITKEAGYESSDNTFKYKINGLKKNTSYTIQILANDGHDEGLSKAIHQTTSTDILYSVTIDQSNSNPDSRVTYGDDAIGIQPGNSTSLGGWENKWPFNQIRIVGLRNGQVEKEIKKENKKQYIDGTIVQSDVDVMTEFPIIYWQKTSSGSKITFSISDAPLEGFFPYAHQYNEQVAEKIYIADYLSYVSSSKLRSISGIMPTTQLSLTTIRSYAENKGTGYCSVNINMLTMVWILFLLSHKNTNTTMSLGTGPTTLSKEDEKIKTGSIDTKGWIYGDQTNVTKISYLGIEDIYGTLEFWVDGMRLKNDDGIYINLKNSNQTQISNYTKVGTYNKFNQSYLKEIDYGEKTGFFPLIPGGSDTTYYGPTYTWLQRKIEGDSFLRAGGLYYGDSGMFYFNMSFPETLTSSNLTGRLAYIKV